MDIFLSHGYFIAEDEHEQQIMKPYPTLGLLYISSYLKAKGFDVDLYDTTFRTMADFEAYVRESRPGLVGLYCNLMTKQNILKQIQICKQVGSKVVLGGPEPINYAEEYLDAGADIIVSGEGELTLEELISHLARFGLQELDKVNGIVFREGNQLFRTVARAQIADLSAQPWPDREAIDMDRYLETWKTHHGVNSVSLITARGCPYTCNWCSHSVFGYTHRRRRPEEVVEEVAWIQERYKPDQLWYADDVLTIHPRWFLTYTELMKERGLHLPFECISRADRLNEKIIDGLADLGCYRLWIGAESGSQRILDAMERKADVADIQAKTKMLQAKGIEVGMFIMLGYEGEEITDIEETVDHLKKSSPDVFLTTVAYPIKGTKYYDKIESRIAANAAWEARTDRDLIVQGRRSPLFYEHANRYMINEVKFHQSRQSGSRNYPQLAKMWLNAKRGWFGMQQADGERREDGTSLAIGRGWTAKDRAEEGW